MKFKYSARNREGAVVNGVMEAKSRNAVAEILQSKDLLIVDIQEDVGINLQSLQEINIGGVPMEDKVIFMRQFATMISASLPITQALQILRDQATNPKFKRILTQVLSDVEDGTSFSKSIAKHEGVFDKITISMISAGEESGQMEKVLRRLAGQMEKTKKLNDKVKSAFIYPTLIVVVVIAVMVLLVMVLVPAMKTMYDDLGAGELPFATQLLVDLSDFLKSNWIFVLVFLLVTGIAIKYYLDTDAGKLFFNKMALKIPVFGKLAQYQEIARFTRTLSLLLHSGLSIVEALRLTSEAQGNLLFSQAVMTAKNEVEKGVSLSLPISRSEVFPLIISQMISVGEETGELDKVLTKMADFYDDELNMMTANLSSLLEPMILLIMGGLIGFIALAVYMPMFSLGNFQG